MRLRSVLPLNLPLAITVLAWGFNFVALKVLYAQMTAPAVAVVRFGLMYAILVAICLYKREPLSYPKKDAGRLVVFGIMSMGIYMILFLEGMRNTAPAEAAILINTSPFMTVLLYALLGRERLTRGKLLGAAIGFLGVVFVVFSGSSKGSSSLQGMLTILVSALAWAVCVTLSQPLLKEYSPLRVLTLSMPPGFLLLLPYGLLSAVHTDYGKVTPFGWLMVAHVAVVSGVIAFICFYEGVRRVGGTGAAIVMYLVPPTTAVCAWLVMKSSLTLMQAVGVIVVLIGLAIGQRAKLAEMAERSLAQQQIPLQEPS